MPLKITSSPPLVPPVAPVRIVLFRLSVVFASVTVPLVPRPKLLDVPESVPELMVAGPAMMILFAIVSAPVAIRLNEVPVLSLTVAEPSEVATVPTSRTPALTIIVPAMPGLSAVRTRLPWPSLVKPLAATSTELMIVVPPVHGPR